MTISLIRWINVILIGDTWVISNLQKNKVIIVNISFEVSDPSYGAKMYWHDITFHVLAA